MELPLTKTCAQITQFISDVPLSQILTPGSGVGQKTNFESVNENVMEMKELLNKFKAFSDYTEPQAKPVAKFESNLNHVKNFGNKFSIGTPKLKLF